MSFNEFINFVIIIFRSLGCLIAVYEFGAAVEFLLFFWRLDVISRLRLYWLQLLLYSV